MKRVRYCKQQALNIFRGNVKRKSSKMGAQFLEGLNMISTLGSKINFHLHLSASINPVEVRSMRGHFDISPKKSKDAGNQKIGMITFDNRSSKPS